jgi:sulfur dioxygenase
MIFRHLYDSKSSTYTYLLADKESRQAILIDPVFENLNRDSALIYELGLTLKYSVDTHVHADHITSAWMLKQQLGSQMIFSANSGTQSADIYCGHTDQIHFGGRSIEFRSTPGHTNGCMTLVLEDNSMAFTGDCLLIRGAGRTDFQQGDPHAMYQSIQNQILSLPGDTLLWPAHDYAGRTVTTVDEECQFNPRFGGNLSESDFVGYMENLNLPHPNQIKQAVPANLQCGKPGATMDFAMQPDWAPLRYTFGGVWEVEPQWLEENNSRVQLIDVREKEEFTGILGHIEDARNIPLGKLLDNTTKISTDTPIILVCRAGGRSAQATTLLGKQGFQQLANLKGGMIDWRANGYPVTGGESESFE